MKNSAHKKLIIAEKPSVAVEIGKVLGIRGGRGQGYLEGSQYVISWAVGHLVNIAEPGDQSQTWSGRWRLEQLPMIPQKFKLTVLDKTSQQFNLVSSLMQREDVGEIINATDAGREGELIFMRIYLQAGCSKPILRLWASDMTEAGLKKAIANLLPAQEKRNLGLAAFARAEADWLVGMNFSRIFTLKTGKLVTVGRVQTPVLKLLVARGKEIENFKPQDYWTIESSFSHEDGKFKATWFAPPKRKENKVWELDKATELADKCRNKPAMVDSVNSSKGTLRTPLPFDLTTLQREANTRFGLSAQKTLEVAQSLYEEKKLLTYPRTDSRYLTQEIFKEILGSLRAIYPHFPEISTQAAERIKAAKKTFACVNDKKVSDHHAIIPTTGKANPNTLSPEQWNIYEMVCRRTIATFLPNCTFLSSTLWLIIEDQPFKATGKIFTSKGWLQAEPWRTAKDNPLPKLKEKDVLQPEQIEPVKHTTKPPAQFTDASLLGVMETAGKLVEDDKLRDALKERGLGTPATRAQVIETLLSRNYVQKKGKKLLSTPDGCNVIQTVEDFMPQLVSPELTGQWEQRLKEIEADKISYGQFMQQIKNMVYNSIIELKNKKFPSTPAVLPKGITSIGKCPLCGGYIVESHKAFGCINWKDINGGCKFNIWKNISGADINKEKAQELLTKGTLNESLEFKNKNNNVYKGKLVLTNGKIFIRGES